MEKIVFPLLVGLGLPFASCKQSATGTDSAVSVDVTEAAESAEAGAADSTASGEASMQSKVVEHYATLVST
ncbi:MAG: hypothetical protein CMP27_15810, partial [Roseibacillus sp.]|nr:hypothetical protein [Roseibacillus sp.]